MPPALTLETLTTPTPTIITRVTGGVISIGREPENSVQLESAALSRRHSNVEAAGDEWVVRDLESSNGTFLNGVRLEPAEIKLLRSGDQLTLADVPLLVKLDGVATPSIPSLVIFEDGLYLETFQFQASSAFTIGDENAHLTIQGHQGLQHIAQIDLVGTSLNINANGGVQLGGMAISGTSQLDDRAQLSVGRYLILVSSPPSSERGDDISQEEWEARVRQKAEAARARYVFGELPKGDTGISAFAETSTQRTIGISEPAIDYSQASPREKLVIFLGAVMSLAIVAAIVILIVQFL